MPDPKFLEEYPLYRKFRTQIPSDYNQVPWPAIQMRCRKCKAIRTFSIRSPMGIVHGESYHPRITQRNHSVAGRIALAIYICASCQQEYQAFLLKFDDKLSFVMKVGQFPPWNITVHDDLSRLLGRHEGNFRKGLTCESQGYGIGAYSYYRRIVEEIIDKLLSSIQSLLSEDEKVAYEQALQAAKKTTVASEKIDLVKDLLPSSLRSGNMNPLSILHATLSEGMHDRTDEECLEAATHIREILVYLVDQINSTDQAQGASKRFTDSMRRLLDKKKQRNL